MGMPCKLFRENILKNRKKHTQTYICSCYNDKVKKTSRFPADFSVMLWQECIRKGAFCFGELLKLTKKPVKKQIRLLFMQ